MSKGWAGRFAGGRVGERIGGKYNIKLTLLLETLEAEYKTTLLVAYTLRCEDPDSKLNAIPITSFVFENVLKTPKQFLSFSKTIS